MRKSKEKMPIAVKDSTVTVLPSPKLNLHDLEAVRREMARVYRDMRGGAIDTQDGTRLVYVLGEMRKLFEIIELERRIQALEEK
jgi:hypothetical protein